MRRRSFEAHGLLSDVGRILVDCPPGLVSCVLRDVTARGARLVVPDAIRFPDKLCLLVDAEDASLPCTVVWRRAGEMGVVFA
ncbi:PilZ domain-containing protein [Methylobacterium sp. ID0610]|uniref:PilZ domain-containing protein n=1 Tax=Methylobacterium carpenticola TaxID=3344827 RepID=UPI0036B35FEA